jgi:hypothetical protein
MSGEVAIGYEVNKTKKLVMVLKDKICCGMYGVSFDRRSLFVVQAIKKCEGYAIRKRAWKNILKQHKIIAQELLKKVKQ